MADGPDAGERLSQTLLARDGFHVVDGRVDDEDGPLICWRLEV